MNKWLKVGRKMASFWLAQPCSLCLAPAAGDAGLCDGCLADLPWHTEAACPRCALPSMQGLLCGHCLAHTPAFDRTIAALCYGYPLDCLIQQYKYGQQLALARTFAALLTRHSALLNARPDVLMAMPLHPQRLQERGFNQSNEIAKHLSRDLNIPLLGHVCHRIKLSPPQATLPYKQRRDNMQGAFACSSRLDGLHIALVDDVMTTGASFEALAKTVKKAGAREVSCWALARTLI